MNDILVMGRLDVFVDEGKHETIVLNYQTLDEEVIDYEEVEVVDEDNGEVEVLDEVAVVEEDAVL